MNIAQKYLLDLFFGYGAQSGAWGLLVINLNGDITVTHKYSSATLTWDVVDISVSYIYQAYWFSVSHDYIVAQGTSGIWFYRKWNSGLAEFWGGKQMSGIGSINVPAVDFPFALVSLLYKSASAIYSSGSKGVYILSGSGASSNGLTDTGVYKINQDIKDESTTTVASIEYSVKGLWK